MQLQRLDVIPREIDARAYKLAAARADHVSRIVTEPMAVHVGGALAVVYLPFAQTTELLTAVKSIKFGGLTGRTGGMAGTSRIFGFCPRRTLRADYCTSAAMAQEEPSANAIFFKWGAIFSEALREANPAVHAQQVAQLAQVRPEWRIPGAVFTQGIVNENNILSYHRDAGNFPESWSVMATLAYDVEGGELVLPALDLAFDYTKPAITMFCGAEYIHGVAPLRRRSASSYRYSIVYYANRGMCKCGSVQDELARIRTVKTDRETRRAKGQTPT